MAQILYITIWIDLVVLFCVIIIETIQGLCTVAFISISRLFGEDRSTNTSTALTKIFYSSPLSTQCCYLKISGTSKKSNYLSHQPASGSELGTPILRDTIRYQLSPDHHTKKTNDEELLPWLYFVYCSLPVAAPAASTPCYVTFRGFYFGIFVAFFLLLLERLVRIQAREPQLWAGPVTVSALFDSQEIQAV